MVTNTEIGHVLSQLNNWGRNKQIQMSNYLDVHMSKTYICM